ncbi:MAG: transposase [Pseudomonadota bacterium]
MPNYRRANATGGTYFFTLTSYRRAPILVEASVRLALRKAIQQTRLTMPFEIDAWVLLPDHLHCIWTLPQDDCNFSARWSNIKRLVTQQCGAMVGADAVSASRANRRESGLWQRRFWEHQIQDDDDFARHVDYIHWNPVKHGLVTRAFDWPHSTLHRFVEAGMYRADWGMAAPAFGAGLAGE